MKVKVQFIHPIEVFSLHPSQVSWRNPLQKSQIFLSYFSAQGQWQLESNSLDVSMQMFNIDAFINIDS